MLKHLRRAMKLTPARIDQLDFSKSPDGLLPAIIQDVTDDRILMLGYVNEESLRASFASERVTFYSRSKRRLWTKGESSGNVLHLLEAHTDCDRDAVLMLVHAEGPTCHTGQRSCFDEAAAGETDADGSASPSASSGMAARAAGRDSADDTATGDDLEFLRKLENLLHTREADAESESYTARLLAKGTMKVAQKVGEEGVEMALEAVGGTEELLLEEAADLMYHYLLLLRAKGKRLRDVVKVLQQRSA